MDVTSVLFVLIALTVKHFVFDFLLQPITMLYSKRLSRGPTIYGLVHAGEHFVGTMLALTMALPYMPLFWAIAVVEFFIHYAIDTNWHTKDVLRRVLDADSDTSETDSVLLVHDVWIYHGYDQWLHYLTYLVITVFLVWYTNPNVDFFSLLA